MRTEKLSTTVTKKEKQAFRVVAATDGMNMSEKLRELVYEELEDNGHETSREGNATRMTPETAD